MNSSTNKMEEKFNKLLLIKSMMTAYRMVESDLRAFLKPHGITLQQYNVLKILRGANEPLSTSKIRERMLEPMADSSRLVERLCAKGWVKRNACCKDRRLVDVTISKEGASFLDHIPAMDSVLDKLYRKINSNEASTLNKLLNKMRK